MYDSITELATQLHDKDFMDILKETCRSIGWNLQWMHIRPNLSASFNPSYNMIMEIREKMLWQIANTVMVNHQFIDTPEFCAEQAEASLYCSKFPND